MCLCACHVIDEARLRVEPDAAVLDPAVWSDAAAQPAAARHACRRATCRERWEDCLRDAHRAGRECFAKCVSECAATCPLQAKRAVQSCKDTYAECGANQD